MSTRRKFSKEYKAKITLEALKEAKTLPELAAEYQIHPAQIATWKKKAKTELCLLFADGREKETKLSMNGQKEFMKKLAG